MVGVFVALLALNLVAPWPVLAWLRRRWELEASFLGLVAVGAGAAIAALLGAMGGWTAWQALAPVPAELPRAEVMQRWDVLFFTTIALGFLLELVKYYGAQMFHTRMVRGSLPLFGVSVGAGAGMLSALWVLGSTGWAALAGAEVLGLKAAGLGVQHLGQTLLEVAVCSAVLYRAAEGRRVEGVVVGGLLHGAALLCATLLSQRVVGGWQPWVGGAVYVGVAALVGGGLWQRVRQRGWPM